MIKKIIIGSFVLGLLFSCGANKKVADKAASGQEAANFKNALDQIQKTYIQDSTIAFNSRLQYVSNGSSQPKVNVQTNIRNNELIWANASMVVPLGRILITPDGAKGYAKFPKKVYFDSDYSFIEDKVQLKDLEYEQIESLLTGRPLFALNTQDYDFRKTEAGYLFSYKKNAKLIQQKSKTDVARTVELNDRFLVTKQTFTKPDTNTQVEVLYTDFEEVDGQYFPMKMQILISDKKNIEINMEHKSIKVNDPIQTPFKLPTNYKKIDF